MFSILHIFVAFYILFTLLTDYVRLHPLILVDWSQSSEHGYSNPTKSGETWPSKSKTALALASERYSTTTKLEDIQTAAETTTASLKRPCAHCPHPRRDGDQCNEPMEVPYLQEGMQCCSSVLWNLWSILALVQIQRSSPHRSLPRVRDQFSGTMQPIGLPKTGTTSNGRKSKQTAISGQRHQEGDRPHGESHRGKESTGSQTRPKVTKAKAKIPMQMPTNLVPLHCQPIQRNHLGCPPCNQLLQQCHLLHNLQ